jgi:hypothetical protein
MSGIAESPASSYVPWKIWQEVERAMHELDNRKDQMMTIGQVALANLTMWVRDGFFPSTYAHATRAPLATVSGWKACVRWDQEGVLVELRLCNNRQLTRDLVAV